MTQKHENKNSMQSGYVATMLGKARAIGRSRSSKNSGARSPLEENNQPAKPQDRNDGYR